jgi:predicted heme/steroid binding protein
MFQKVFVSSVLFAAIVIYFNTAIIQYFQSFVKTSVSQDKQVNLFTKDELKLYNGIDKPQLYLAILGKVFDVSTGASHYGNGATYNFFIGRDASRSFVTGKFDVNDVSDQVADLTAEELRSVNHWVQFYNKDYKRVGKLIGRYYGADGKLSRYGKEVKKLIQAAELSKDNEDLEKLKYPPCNVEWDAQRGTRVWCTEKSGGISRDWVGVPRQLYLPGSQDYRCACVKNGDEVSASLKRYDGCDDNSHSCFVTS